MNTKQVGKTRRQSYPQTYIIRIYFRYFIVDSFEMLLLIFSAICLLLGTRSLAEEATRNSTPKSSYAYSFYNLALSRYNQTTKDLQQEFQLPKLQIIRVPKASSTSLSIVARRMVGCNPPGPCCKFPGEPAGTCPSPELAECIKQKKVVGCIGHSVDMRAFRNRTIPSISVVREPTSRSLSAFFYPGMHHNSDCTRDPAHSRLDCFKLYLVDRRFRNVLVKMLNGDFAYAKATTCRSAETCKHSLEKAKENLSLLNFVGVTEMWELSLLLLHYRFRKLRPVLAEFAVSEESSPPATLRLPSNLTSSSVGASSGFGSRALTLSAPAVVANTTFGNVTAGSFNVRTNSNPEYKIFKKMAMKEFSKQLHKQNEFDIQLYTIILEGLCDKLHKYRLWKIDTVQQYWKERAPFEVKRCS